MERFDLIANYVTRLMRLEHEHRQYMYADEVLFALLNAEGYPIDMDDCEMAVMYHPTGMTGQDIAAFLKIEDVSRNADHIPLEREPEIDHEPMIAWAAERTDA